MIEENKAKEYADNLYPDASPNNAPYHTTGDSWDDCRNAFIAGYESAESDAREKAIKAFDHLNLFEFTTVECVGDFDRIYEETREQFIKYYNKEKTEDI